METRQLLRSLPPVPDMRAGEIWPPGQFTCRLQRMLEFHSIRSREAANSRLLAPCGGGGLCRRTAETINGVMENLDEFLID